MDVLEIVCQGGICFGLPAAFLVSTKGKWQRYGFLLGLIAQPFWYITTYRNEQWGIFFLSFFYTFTWINGIRNHWIRRSEDD